MPWLAAAGALGVYGASLHVGVPGGDAGELMSAACAGGVAHPPGYPLHGLLLRVAGLVPLGALPLRHNATSALCGAATVGLLLALVRRWTGSAAAGALSAGLWLACGLAWRYATTTEVFALHTLLVVAVAWAATALGAAPSGRRACALGLLAGLALTHHPTALFAVGPLVVWSVAVQRPPRLPLAFGLALGAAPLALLALWSRTPTPFSWGDAGSLDGFFAHVLRRDYGTFRLASRDDVHGTAWPWLVAFARFEWTQLAGVAVGLAALGARRAWPTARGAVLAGVAALVLAVGAFGALANLPLDQPLFAEVAARFFLLPHLVLCAAAGLGLAAVLRRWPHRWLGPALVLALTGFAWTQAPRHRPDVLERYAQALLAQPPGALVLARGDLVSGLLRAAQACRGERPDLHVVDQELLTYPWYVERVRRARPGLQLPGSRWHPDDPTGFRLDALLRANPSLPVVVCGGLKEGDPSPVRLRAEGLCEALSLPSAGGDDEAWWARAVAASPAPLPGSFPPGAWEAVAQRDVWNARARLGLHALEVGIARSAAPWLERARSTLAACTQGDPSPAPETWKNLGIAAGRLGRTDEMRAAFGRYLPLAPPTDADLATIRALLAQ